jgi:hypothetical protein
MIRLLVETLVWISGNLMVLNLVRWTREPGQIATFIVNEIEPTKSKLGNVCLGDSWHPIASVLFVNDSYFRSPSLDCYRYRSVYHKT